ncbi:threonine-phosphate decarboxylase CobD [Desmospora profundinema]|uniref:threonine-phosphate decarboxylase n=1 Tax=Desmospora profundinema TaxID=1571184 RepID=A0ABU1IMT5_9BACL|nr:threonine-phosphate decarboxylase CobD [Desmospora profundinema]MDR6226100.1 threonine-phosphate decarboxylase [Desmospora profundinema]
MSGVERYGHGGDRWTAGFLFHREASDFLDFSANINPLGPPPGVLEVLHRALTESGQPVLTQYPDPRSRSLKRALARKCDVPVDWVAVGNGGAELLDLVHDIIRPRRVGVTHPSFSEYEAAARKRGSEVVPLPLSEERDWLPGREELLRWVRQVDLAYLGHPNNPTGTLFPEESLIAAAEEAARHGSVLVVDEAFLDFVPGAFTLQRQLSDFPTTLLVRSMTKFYALPGLRLGYALASPSWVKKLEARQIPWSVNGLAQLAGEAALSDREYEERTADWLHRERLFLLEGLKRVAGVHVFPGSVNYLLLRLTGRRASGGYSSHQWQRALGERGILIRDASTYPGLDDTYIRVAVRSREENERLLSAFIEWETERKEESR